MDTIRLGSVGIIAWALSLSACDSIPEGCDHYVRPGGDDRANIQAAFIEANDGDTVCLAAGTFTLVDPLEIRDRTNFTLRGMGPEQTVLDFSGQELGGTGIGMTNMTNVVVEDLGIVDAAGNGLRIEASEGVVIRRVHAGWTTPEDVTNGKYAIYPVSSTDVLVEDSLAYGSSDAGIYVGQVTNCVVRNNTARGNVAGIEIENSQNCEVYGNTAEGNTGGILVFELPGLPLQGAGTLVRDNVVRDNNVYNFAEEGSIVGALPRGTGIFLLAANDVEITGNTVTGNEGTGLALISWGTAQALGLGEATDPAYDPWAERIHVHDNTFGGNGTMPGGDGRDSSDPLLLVSALLAGAGVDVSAGLETILWDGLVRGGDDPSDVLCIRANGDASFRNLDIANLAGGGTPQSTTDPSPHDCSFPSRPPVDLGG
ncbi:MAG TPA: parallel beta-helix domain-containing protein [Sandaracinaceae bacterium]